MATLGPKTINELPVFETLTGNEYVPLQLGKTTGTAQLVQVSEFLAGQIPLLIEELVESEVGTALENVQEDFVALAIAVADSNAQLLGIVDEVGTGSGAPVTVPYLQTISDINAGNPVSLFRFIDQDQHSAIRSFSATQNTSDAVASAFASGARRLVADYGLYNMESSVVTAAPIVLEGSGPGTIFNQVSVSDRASFQFKSSADGQYIDGVQFRNFVVQCLNGTFAEQQHLVVCDGVRNARFESIKANGFRGDALYFGSGIGADQRHNENVYVGRCVFDGINNENRNAISVIDVDGMVIELSAFLRCTRSNMPGPIDFEPNAAAWHIVRNVSVNRNRFRANGGSLAEVGIYVPSAVTVAPSNIMVEGNESDGYVGAGAFFAHNTNRLASDARPDSVIKVRNNRASNGYRPWTLYDGKGVEFSGNTWDGFAREAFVGFTGATNNALDVTVSREKFARVGTVGQVGLSIFAVSKLKLRDVLFEDCGTGSATSYAIDFNTGTSSYVDIDGLTVTSPTGKTLTGIQKEVAHTFTPKTNKFYRSSLSGLPNNFQSHESDSIETNYLPAIGGSTTTGAGVYTSQLGRAKRIGTKAFVRINVTCDAAHITNNTGIIQISLPWPAKQNGTNDTRIEVTVIGVTAATSPGQYGRLVQALTVDGVLGAVRVYTNATGVQGNVVIPNNAFTVLANFSYEVAEGY
jgi:ribosomal protein S16